MHRTEAGMALGAGARARLDVIVEDLMERQWYEVPEFWVTDDPAFREAVHRSTRENIELMLELVERPAAPPRVLCAGARLEADVSAQYGAPAHALLRTYHLGEYAMAEHFLDVIDAGELDDGRLLLRELRGAMQSVHAYMGAVMPLVAREHADERERVSSHPELRRLRLVQSALAGDAVAELDYDPAGTHVAVVATGDRASVVIGRVADRLGAPALSVRIPDGRTWAWLRTSDEHEVSTRLQGALDGNAGIGGPADFRVAHEQALLAERIARRTGAPAVVGLRSVALEALALGDQRTAFAVARAELGPLAGAGGARHRHLRQTLEAWFTARENVGATAAALEIAPRTVSYRLRRVEALLGHPIAARRAELEAALRVERLRDASSP
ncbi:MAG TPA: helix-turn-helix domain-containing protein [Solirubrobacteraceae bacterium]